MRPITSSLLAAFAVVSAVGATAAQARPVGGRPGVSVRTGGMSYRAFGRPVAFGRSGFGRNDRFGHGRGRRGFGFADGYGGFGYGASGYYGYGSGYGYGGYVGPLPGAGYLDGPYGPLIVPGYGGIADAPVQPPAIYVIDKPSTSRPSTSRRGAAGTSASLASLSTEPERAGPRVIAVPQVRR